MSPKHSAIRMGRVGTLLGFAVLVAMSCEDDPVGTGTGTGTSPCVVDSALAAVSDLAAVEIGVSTVHLEWTEPAVTRRGLWNVYSSAESLPASPCEFPQSGIAVDTTALPGTIHRAVIIGLASDTTYRFV